MEQQEWIARARTGERTAIAHLFEENVQFVYYLSCQLTGSLAQAGEVTRRAFVRAFTRMDSLREDVSFDRWLTAITVNLCKENLKKTQPQLFVTNEDEMAMLNDVLLTGEDCLPPDCLTRPELRGTALKLIDALPPRQRACVYLYYAARLQPHQAAKVLGVDEVTVRGRLNSAQYTLRSQMQRIEPFDVGAPLVSQLLLEQASQTIVPEVLRGSCLQSILQPRRPAPTETPKIAPEPAPKNAAKSAPKNAAKSDPKDAPKDASEAKSRKPWYRGPYTKQQKIYFGAAAAGLVLLIVLLVLVLHSCGTEEPPEVPQPAPAEQEQIDMNQEAAALLEEYGVEALLACSKRESQKLLDDWQKILPDYVLSGKAEDLDLQAQTENDRVVRVSLSLEQADLDITRLDGLELGEKPLVSATADAIRAKYDLICTAEHALLFDPQGKAEGSTLAYSEHYRYEFIDTDGDRMFDHLVITHVGDGWDWEGRRFAPYGGSVSDLLGRSCSEAEALLGKGSYSGDGVSRFDCTLSGADFADVQLHLHAVLQSRTQMDAAREQVNGIVIETAGGDVSSLLPELGLPKGRLTLNDISSRLQNLSGRMGLQTGDPFDPLTGNPSPCYVAYYIGTQRYLFFAQDNGAPIFCAEVLDLRDCVLWDTSAMRFKMDGFDLQELLGLTRYEAYQQYGLRGHLADHFNASGLGLWEAGDVIRTVYNAADPRPLWGVRLGDSAGSVAALVEQAGGYCYERSDTAEGYVMDDLELKLQYASGSVTTVQLLDHSADPNYQPPEPLRKSDEQLYTEFLQTHPSVRTSFAADFDRDGSLDLLVAGEDGPKCMVQVYSITDGEVEATARYVLTLDAGNAEGGSDLRLYEEDGAVWLLTGTHTEGANPACAYRLYCLDSRGAELVREEDSASLSVFNQLFGGEEDYDRVLQAYGSYVDQSVFVCGTGTGMPTFSDHSAW